MCKSRKLIKDGFEQAMKSDSRMALSIRKQKYSSLVERVFDDPKIIGQGEYTAIYDFLLDLDERDDPEFVVVVLEEFSRWAQYMIERMRQSIQPQEKM